MVNGKKLSSHTGLEPVLPIVRRLLYLWTRALTYLPNRHSTDSTDIPGTKNISYLNQSNGKFYLEYGHDTKYVIGRFTMF